MPRGLCALRDLVTCVPVTMSYFVASSAFDARFVTGINLYHMKRPSRGPFPNASKRQFGNTHLGSMGLLLGWATGGVEGNGRESCQQRTSSFGRDTEETNTQNKKKQTKNDHITRVRLDKHPFQQAIKQMQSYKQQDTTQVGGPG